MDDCDADWDSDNGRDYDLVSLDGSGDEGPRYPTCRYGQDMENFKLVVGIKFKSVSEFREL